MPTAILRHAALRAASPATLQVDEENGIIYGVSLITVGPTKGHGFDIDSTTVDQLIELASEQPEGVKSRFKHPKIETDPETGNTQVDDDLGSVIGVVRNARRDGDRARGDLYIGDCASALPGEGDVRTYLLKLATEHPEQFGMSAMFTFEVEPQTDGAGNVVSLPARLIDLEAIDVVGSPAANPHGMLSARRAYLAERYMAGGGWQDSNPQPPATAPFIPPDFDDLIAGAGNDDIALMARVAKGQLDDSDDDAIAAMDRPIRNATRAIQAGAQTYGPKVIDEAKRRGVDSANMFPAGAFDSR